MKVEAIDVRRPQGLLRRRVQPRRRLVAAAPADGLGRGRGHRAAAPGRAGRASSSRSRIPRTARASASRCRAASSTRCGSTSPTASACTSTAGRSCSRRSGEFRLRALSIERFGLGEHLAALERLKAKLAAEGLFAAERKRPLPVLPRADRPRDRERRRREARRPDRDHDALPARERARRRDLRPGPARRRARSSRRCGALPRAASTSSSSPAAAAASRTCCRSATSGSCARSPTARCPSSARSATSRTRRSATSPPTCAPRRRRAAGRLVVPDLAELLDRLDRSRAGLARGARRSLERAAQRARPARTSVCAARRACSSSAAERSSSRRAGRLRAPSPARDARARLRDRPRRASRSSAPARPVEPGERVEVELAEGGFGARVEETRDDLRGGAEGAASRSSQRLRAARRRSTRR